MHQAGPNKPIYNDAWKQKFNDYLELANLVQCVAVFLVFCGLSRYE